MDQRDHDRGTTQRRTLRPAQDGDGGREPARLVVLQGRRLGHRIDLGDQPLVIGRGAECDFQILERSVSREHCRIWREPAGHRIKDLDSTNKTFLNDQPIIEAELKDGDHVSIGNCVLKFMDSASVEARYHEEIYQLATVDPLTEVYNRRQFLELLEKELARAANHDRLLALLIIDLDHFKAVNDRHGHQAGDRVLKRVAAILRGHAQGEFILARIGGEEFAVVLPEYGIGEAIAFGDRLRTAIADADLAGDDGVGRITVSIGAAVWTPAMEQISDLLRAADEELYRAKQSGRNRVCGGPARVQA